MKFLLLALVCTSLFLGLVTAQPQPQATCSSVYNCLGFIISGQDTTSLGLTAGTTAAFETLLEGVTSVNLNTSLFSSVAATQAILAKSCPFPSCPEGYVVDPSNALNCKRSTSSLYQGSGANTTAYANLAQCLADNAAQKGVFATSTSGSYSFRIRNCMQPFNSAYKTCLYNLGILG